MTEETVETGTASEEKVAENTETVGEEPPSSSTDQTKVETEAEAPEAPSAAETDNKADEKKVEAAETDKQKGEAGDTASVADTEEKNNKTATEQEEKEEKKRRFPFHEALKDKELTRDKISEWLTQDHLCQLNELEELPLHIAAQSVSDYEIIKEMVELYPEAVSKQTNMGYLPLHWAVNRAIVAEVSQKISHFIPEINVNSNADKDGDDENDNDNENDETTAEPAPPSQFLAGTTEKGSDSDEDAETPFKMLQLFLEHAPETVALIANTRNQENTMHAAARNGASAKILRMLHDACPESVKAKDKDGLPPIRHADQRSVLAFFHEVYPEALFLAPTNNDNNNNDSDKHTLIQRFLNTLSSDCLDFLLESHPDLILKPFFGTRRDGKTGGTLLHQAVVNHVFDNQVTLSTTPVGTLRWMARRCPEACATPDDDGCLPIHLMAVKSGNAESLLIMDFLISKKRKEEEETEEKAEEQTDTNDNKKEQSPLYTGLVEKDPSLLLKRNKAGRTPAEELISAINSSDAAKGLRWIVRTCPESASCLNPETGCLPIHMAIQNSRGSCVQTLAKEAHATLMKTNSQGFLPIHDAIDQKWSFTEVRQLFSLKTDVAFVPDTKDRRLLLHWLLLKGYFFIIRPDHVDLSLIKEVHKAFPQAACARDKQARAPMHCAASQIDLPLEMMKLLIDWWPEGLVSPDADGWLPVELACQACCDLDVIFCMLQANPQQVAMMCNKEKWTNTMSLTMAPSVTFSLGTGGKPAASPRATFFSFTGAEPSSSSSASGSPPPVSPFAAEAAKPQQHWSSTSGSSNNSSSSSPGDRRIVRARRPRQATKGRRK